MKNKSSKFLNFVDFLFSLPRSCLPLLVFGFIGLLIWVANWDVFDRRITRTSYTLPGNVEVTVDYLVSGDQIIGSYPVSLQAVKVVTTDWLGQNPYPQCVFKGIEKSSLASLPSEYIEERAEAELTQDQLPMWFDEDWEGVNIDEGIPCDTTHINFDVSVVLGSAYKMDGNFVIAPQNGYEDYEVAYIVLPAKLYDEVLYAAVTGADFSLDTWYPTETDIPGDRLVSYYQTEAQDRGNLTSWMLTQQGLLSRIYKVLPILATTTGSVTVSEYQGNVDVPGTGTRKCEYNYRGVPYNCKFEYKSQNVYEDVEVPLSVGSYILP